MAGKFKIFKTCISKVNKNVRSFDSRLSCLQMFYVYYQLWGENAATSIATESYQSCERVFKVLDSIVSIATSPSFLYYISYMDYVSYIYSISYKLCISLYIIHQYITITCVCKVLDSIVSIATSPSSLALHLVIKVTPFTVGFIKTQFSKLSLTSFSFSTILSPICLELVIKPIRLICLVSWVSDFKTRKCFLRFPLFKRQHHCTMVLAL